MRGQASCSCASWDILRRCTRYLLTIEELSFGMARTRKADLKDKLAIAHAIMDADHQRCNRLVLQIIELSSHPAMRFEIVGELVRELQLYALSHYAREESFMEISGFPEAADHKREHALQLEEIAQIAAAVVERDQPAVSRLMHALFANWIKHRDEHDNKLSEFIDTLER